MRRRTARVLAVITVGGALGAVARHAVSLVMPTAGGGLPWSTLIVNVSGCLLIGVLMVLILEARQAHPLVRPFIGVGVLGGYTTFSTYAVDAQVLIAADRPGLALAYLAGTATAALLAVQLGVGLARVVARPRPESRAQRTPSRGGSR